METLATTRLSSKGQVVIPENIRKKLNLTEGDQFVVLGQRDVVILKAITPPSREEFKDLLAESRRQARKAGLKKKDVRDAIKKARKAK